MSIKRAAKRTIRRILIAAVKPFPGPRNAARQLLCHHRTKIYLKIRRNHPTEPKTIIFESFMGRSYSDSPKAIYQQMLKDSKFDDYHFIWAFKPEKLVQLADNPNPELAHAELIQTGTPEYYAAYARAAIWLTNSRLPDYLVPRKNQKYIQTWHGTALKRLGHDIELDGGNAMYTHQQILDKNDQDAKRYYAMISPSPFMTKVLNSSFALPTVNPRCQIWETGYPRNDRLVKPTKREIAQLKKELNLPKDKQIILYAPTWRDNQHKAGVGYTYQNEMDFDRLQEKFGKTHIILFRAHYFIANSFDFSKYNGFVRDASKIDDVNDLYLVSDLLITDYSSVFFDYALLHRPIVFYMYDLAEYRDKLHGFYMPLSTLPGPRVENMDDLIKLIAKPPKVGAKYDRFVKKYAPWDDGKAAKRVADEIAAINVNSNFGCPVTIMLRPHLRRSGGSVVFSGNCAVKLYGYKEFNWGDLALRVGEKFYPISFVYKKGLRLPRDYRLNRMSVDVPIDDLMLADIQNKLQVTSGGDIDHMGRIIYRWLDHKRGHSRHSKIVFTDDGMSIYLRQTIGNSSYLTVRPSNYLDTNPGVAKVLMAWLLAKLSLPTNRVLLYEKECERYEESASVLYEALRRKGYNNIYYVIDRESPEYTNIPDALRDNVINKHSFKHLYYFFHLHKFIGTETIGHSIQLRTANRLIIRKEHSKKLEYVFLQHGVMYMVSLDSPLRTGFRNRYGYSKYRVVVSSQAEKRHFVELGGLDNDDIYVTGLPKFDKAKRNKDADKIIIMPTWRRWEANQAKTDYESTKYYQMIRRIVAAVPTELRGKIVILPHPLMADALRTNKRYYKYLPDPALPYDQILRDCRLLITDYSSIAYDAFYRGANVLFDWSEKDECMVMYGGETHLMIDSDTAFGPSLYSEGDRMTRQIKRLYNSDQSPDYVKKYRRIVSFHDNYNTKRLISKLLEDEII